MLARRGLATAIELIELGMDADDPWLFEIPQFDAVTPGQQLALLAEVGRALFRKSVRAPVHTAINEAAIYAIFRALELSVQFEIDGEAASEKSTRQLIWEWIAAEREHGAEGPDDDDDDAGVLTPECDDFEAWQFEIECIADKILWDRDWELDDLLVDCSPQKAQLMKRYLGIDDDYFTAIAPDPRDLAPVRRALNRIVGDDS